MIIELDGVEIEGRVDGFGDYDVTIRKEDEDGNISRSFKSGLTFYDDGWDIIKSKLIDDPNGRNKYITIKMYDTCCLEDNGPRLFFNGIIRGDTVDWCDGDCFATADVVEKTDDTDAIDCLKSTLIFDNRNGFQSQNHPRMTYCNELRPSWLHDVILVLGILMNIVYILLYPIAVVVFAIVTFLNFLGADIDFDGDDSTNTLEEYNNLKDNLNLRIIGCGRQHPSPLIRSYIKNVCDICGLTFSSTIYNQASSDYFNAVHYHSPVEKGTYDTSVKYIFENKPNHTGETFLDLYKPLHNARWVVQDGVLYFERKDFFYDGSVWVDYEQLKEEGRVVSNACFSWSDDEKPAYADITYSLDPVDEVGNEAMPRFDDKVEWNQPFNPLQVGKKEVRIAHSPVRVRGDGIDRDVLDDWKWFYKKIDDYKNVILNHKGLSFNPKAICWDGNYSNGKVRKYNYWPAAIPNSQNYNAPYQVNDYNIAPNQIYPTNQPNSGIYQRFYTLDNPKVTPDNGLDFEFSFKYTCKEIRNFSMMKTVQFEKGPGRITEININSAKQICTVTGKL